MQRCKHRWIGAVELLKASTALELVEDARAPFLRAQPLAYVPFLAILGQARMHEAERRRGRSAIGQQREVAKVSDEGGHHRADQSQSNPIEDRQMREAIDFRAA